VLTREEVAAHRWAPGLKYRTALASLMAAGLRASEDGPASRSPTSTPGSMTCRIEQAKARKDRKAKPVRLS